MRIAAMESGSTSGASNTLQLFRNGLSSMIVTSTRLCVCFQVAMLSLVEEVIGRLLLLFLAELVEGWIGAQRVPERIEPEKSRRNRR
jgi:hypothetical protein